MSEKTNEISLSDYHDLKSLNHSPRQIIILRKNGSRRVQTEILPFSETDQSMKKSCDINNILKAYTAQGQSLPQNLDPSLFRDNTNIPSFEAAFDIVNRASEAFYDLPATIRKLIDNDPAQLPSFLADPNNADTLIKHGVLIPKKQAPVDPPKEVKPEADLTQPPKTKGTKE